jgi:hypothetical protein
MFRKIVLPPSSRSKRKSRENPTEACSEINLLVGFVVVLDFDPEDEGNAFF